MFRVPSLGYVLGTTSPLVNYRPPPGMTTNQVLSDFVKRASLQQPLPVIRSVSGSVVRPFLSWSRDHRPGEPPAEHEPGGLADSGTAVPDDGAARHDHPQADPAEGLAPSCEPAEPGAAPHHTYPGDPPDPGRYP